MQDRGQHTAAQAPGELPDGTHHLQPPFGFDLEPKQSFRQFRRKIPSVSRVERRRVRDRITAHVYGEGRLLGPAGVLGGRYVAGEEAAAEAALEGAREVYVAGVALLEEAAALAASG